MFDVNPNYGKPYYVWWRWDKNVNWTNVDIYITRLIIGIFKLKFLSWEKNSAWFTRDDLIFWTPPIDKEKILR